MYAKTDKYYVKKFEAETNITGYLVMDLSRSMGYTYRQELTKFEYADLPGGRAVLPDDPSAGPGGADDLRPADPPQPAPASRNARTWATCSRCWPTPSPKGRPTWPTA